MVIIGVFVVIRFQIPYYTWYNPQESLSHLPAPSSVPGEHVNATINGNLSISVIGSFYTMRPHIGPSTFDFTIDVRVNNTGDSPVTDFHVVKVTMFYESATPFYTFGVVPDSNLTISANNFTWIQEYRNDRDMVSIPSHLFHEYNVFARVLVTFDVENEIILTTPLTSLGHAIE